jgi:hypothetical protein
MQDQQIQALWDPMSLLLRVSSALSQIVLHNNSQQEKA